MTAFLDKVLANEAQYFRVSCGIAPNTRINFPRGKVAIVTEIEISAAIDTIQLVPYQPFSVNLGVLLNAQCRVKQLRINQDDRKLSTITIFKDLQDNGVGQDIGGGGTEIDCFIGQNRRPIKHGTAFRCEDFIEFQILVSGPGGLYYPLQQLVDAVSPSTSFGPISERFNNPTQSYINSDTISYQTSGMATLSSALSPAGTTMSPEFLTAQIAAADLYSDTFAPAVANPVPYLNVEYYLFNQIA